MFNDLEELLKISIEKEYKFNYEIKEGEENKLSISQSDKTINIVIGDVEDKNLTKEITNLLNQLK